MQEIFVEVLERLEEQKKGRRVCEGTRKRKKFVTQRSGSCLWAGAQSLHSQASADWGCCCWSHIAAVLQEPRSRHSAGAARARGVCSCLQSFTVAHCYWCRQARSRKKVLFVSSCHQSPALDRTSLEASWQRNLGNIYSGLQAFRSGDTEKNIRSAYVAKETVSLLGDDEFVIVGMAGKALF